MDSPKPKPKKYIKLTIYNSTPSSFLSVPYYAPKHHQKTLSFLMIWRDMKWNFGKNLIKDPR